MVFCIFIYSIKVSRQKIFLVWSDVASFCIARSYIWGQFREMKFILPAMVSFSDILKKTFSSVKTMVSEQVFLWILVVYWKTLWSKNLQLAYIFVTNKGNVLKITPLPFFHLSPIHTGRRTQRTRKCEQMEPVDVNGGVHTARKQHQRKNVQICVHVASRVLWDVAFGVAREEYKRSGRVCNWTKGRSTWSKRAAAIMYPRETCSGTFRPSVELPCFQCNEGSYTALLM